MYEFQSIKIVLLKDMLLIGQKKVLLLVKLRILFLGLMLNFGSFYEKELQKTNQEQFRIEKVIKRKGDKPYVKWKGYDDSFNSWINKKDIV